MIVSTKVDIRAMALELSEVLWLKIIFDDLKISRADQRIIIAYIGSVQ